MKDRTLNLFEYWLTRVGFHYLVNLRSKEIHDLNKRSERCMIHKIKRRLFVPKFIMLLLLNFGFNGCYWCNFEHDNDVNKKKAK